MPNLTPPKHQQTIATALRAAMADDPRYNGVLLEPALWGVVLYRDGSPRELYATVPWEGNENLADGVNVYYTENSLANGHMGEITVPQRDGDIAVTVDGPLDSSPQVGSVTIPYAPGDAPRVGEWLGLVAPYVAAYLPPDSYRL